MSEPSQPPPVPPVPRYGEYAPAGYVSPVQAPPPDPSMAGVPMRPAPRRKTWDLVLTVILLVVGFFGMLFGVLYGVLFTDPTLIDETLKQQGYSGFSGDVGSAPTVLIVTHVVLYLLALGLAIPLLLRRRVAFWAPLAAGIVAAVIFWSTLVAVLLSDPTFSSQIR